jgi:hypothetical protein
LRRAGKLSADTVILDSFHVRAHGGKELTGPNPTDRRKKGSKHTGAVPLVRAKAGVCRRADRPKDREFPDCYW